MMLENAATAELCVTAGAVSFVAGTASLPIPNECAERSVLIPELRQEADSDQKLPLPLSLEDVKAWLQCASKAAGEVLDRRPGEELIRAHKAAAFLRDERTVAEVLDALATILARAMHDTHQDPSQEARASTLFAKVIAALPQPETLSIFAAIKQVPSPDSKSWPGYVNMLLHLLPHCHHPAIVLAFCVSEPRAGGRLCTIRAHAHKHPAFQEPARVKNFFPYKALNGVDRAAPTTAFQLLAAAAALAGGSSNIAWAPPDAPPAEASTRSAAEDTQPPAAKRVCIAASSERALPQGEDEVWGVPGGGLTRVLLEFNVDDVWQMPSRWCIALAQLVAVRDLRIHLHGEEFDKGKLKFCLLEFTSALVEMPALDKLGLKFDLDRRNCRTSVVDFTKQLTLPLFRTFSQMPQLTDLDLDGCISLLDSDKAPPTELQVLTQLSQLSRLTSLRLSIFFDHKTCRGPKPHLRQTRFVEPPCLTSDIIALTYGVKHLPALETLHAHMIAPGPQHIVHKVNFFLDLLSGPGLCSLTGLNISIDDDGSDEMQPPLPFVKLDRCMRYHPQALAARLTSLGLGPHGIRHLSGPDRPDSRIAAIVADASAIYNVVSAMTALRSLSVTSMELLDQGLQSMARALAGLTALTSLAIVSVGASHTGVQTLLAAMLEPAGVGRELLRSLDLSSSFAIDVNRQETSVQLARSLGQFRGLTHLGVARLHLGVEGLREVVKAVQGLPKLRSVEAVGNVSVLYGESDDELDACTAEAELQGVAKLIPDVEVKF